MRNQSQAILRPLLVQILFTSVLLNAQLENIEYKVSDTVVHITGFNKNFRGQAVIPDTIENLPVTLIGENAFRDCSLTGLALSGNTRVIGANAFAGSKLVSIAFGARVMSIASNAFNGCSQLREVNVAQSNLHYYSVDGVLFRKGRGWHENYLILYPPNRTASSYLVPESTAGIVSNAFKGVSNLISIEVSYTVMFIQEHAFVDCPRLRSIAILASHFGNAGLSFEAFYNLPSLESFTVSKNAHSRQTASLFGGELYEIYPWGWHVLPPDETDTEPKPASIRMAPVIMVEGKEGSVKTIEVSESPDGPWRFWMDVTATASGVAITDLDEKAHKRFYRVRD